MKSKIITLFLSTIILVSGFVDTEKAHAQVSVSAMLVNSKLDVFFISGLDINSGASQPVFFQIDVTVGGEQPITRNIRLHLRMIKDGNIELFTGAVTKPFQVSGIQPIPPLTNRHIFSNGIYGLQDEGSLTDNGEDLLRKILARGKLPTGRYVLEVQVEDLTVPGSSSTSTANIELDIKNYGKLDLTRPGRPAGSSDDCNEIFETVPQFTWTSDFEAFRVIIAEAKPGEDPESCLNQEPRFVKEFFVDPNQTGPLNDDVLVLFEGRRPEVWPLTSFQYPSSGESLIFIPGKTYYWRVTAFSYSTSGIIPFQSEIFCFRIAQFDQISSGLDQYEFILRNFLGADYDDVFGEGGQLQNYRPKRIVLNGEEVALPDILQKLTELSEKYSGYRIVN